MSDEHKREAAMHERLAALREADETRGVVSVDHRLQLAQLHAILHLAEKVEELTAAVRSQLLDRMIGH